MDYSPFSEFNDQVRRRPPSTIGLFFAPFGVTAQALRKVASLVPNHLLLFQMQDLEFAIEKRDLLGIVLAKWRGAVKYGFFDFEIPENP